MHHYYYITNPLFILLYMSANTNTVGHLSDIDKKLLQILLSPNGDVKSSSISKELGVPITTIRRRRKRLETEFLKSYYVLDVDKFGWRRVDFFISIKNGKINSVANKLMEID